MSSRSFSQVLEGLRSWRYVERSFTLVSEGKWTAGDAEWNYLDVPHLNEVHSQADAEVLFYSDDTSSSILRQKVGPLTFLTVLTIFKTAKQELSYVSSVGPILLFVKSRWSDLGPVKAKVDTSYYLFAPRGLGWSLRIVERLLTRNYRILMSEDLPLRERKGSLRLRGYSFLHDGKDHSFLESRKIGSNNLILPKQLPEVEFDVPKSDLPIGGTILVGDDGALGLKLVHLEDGVHVFPRICAHEGACLDEARNDEGTLRCPWHGRKIRSLMTFSPSDTAIPRRSRGITVSDAGESWRIKYDPRDVL